MLSDRCLSCLSVGNVGALWPNGWTDLDQTWHAGRARPRTHCVGWGPSSPSPKGPYLLRSNGCMDQDGTWHGGRTQPRWLCVRWRPSPPLQKGGVEPPPQFSAHSYCGQTAECIKMPHGMEVGLNPGNFVLDGDPAPSPKRGRSPQFSAHVYCGQTAAWIKMPLGMEVGLGLRDTVLDGDPAPLP